MSELCPHFPETQIPTCYGVTTQKFNSFETFLSQNKGEERQELLPIYKQCMTRTNGRLSITDGCIGCLHCVMGCPGRSGTLSFAPRSSDSGIRTVEIRVKNSCGRRQSVGDLREVWQGIRPFSGDVIKFAGLEIQHDSHEFLDFDSFMAVDETKRIAVWTAAMIRALLGDESMIGLEIPIPVEGKPRPGRIDVSVRTQSFVFAIETKTDFDDTMKDLRLFEQIPNYQNHLDSLSAKFFMPRVNQFVVIGGDETALLPQEHPLCASKLGGRAREFYDHVKRMKAPVISAQALLLLALRSLVAEDSGDLFSALVSEGNALALLSNGIVKRTEDTYELCPVEELTRLR